MAKFAQWVSVVNIINSAWYTVIKPRGYTSEGFRSAKEMVFWLNLTMWFKTCSELFNRYSLAFCQQWEVYGYNRIALKIKQK